MNKRQRLKRENIVSKRLKFFNCHIMSYGRMNSRTHLYENILNLCFSKKYKPFKKFKKMYQKLYIGFDLSNGKDYSAMTTCLINKGKINILKCEII